MKGTHQLILHHHDIKLGLTARLQHREFEFFIAVAVVILVDREELFMCVIVSVGLFDELFNVGRPKFALIKVK